MNKWSSHQTSNYGWDIASPSGDPAQIKTVYLDRVFFITDQQVVRFLTFPCGRLAAIAIRMASPASLIQVSRFGCISCTSKLTV